MTRTLKTRQKIADRFIDDIIQCAKVKNGVKTIDKHYLEVVEEIKKDIVKNLK